MNTTTVRGYIRDVRGDEMTYQQAKELLEAERVMLMAAMELFDAGASDAANELIQQIPAMWREKRVGE